MANVFYSGQKDYIQLLNGLWDRATVSLTGTSTTSLAISTGSKSLVTDSDRQWTAGDFVRIKRTSNPTGAYMHGSVTSYTASTGALVVNVTSVVGSGTFTDWTITISGEQGIQGNTGATGAAGLVHRGAWASATAYVVNDAVTYSGSTYRRKVAGTTATNPSADATNWELLAGKGDTGATGPANTLTIGTVTTGAAGSSASATVTGTAPNQTLNLTIPRGDTGATGSTGAAGLVWQGAWVSGTTYAVNDAVTNSGSSYRRKVAGAGTTAPGSDATNWELIAQKGSDGTGNVSTVNNIAPVAGNVTITAANVGALPTDGSGAMTATLLINTAIPAIRFLESDQTGAVGFWRMVADGGDWRVDRNTAVARDFSSFDSPLMLSTAGAVVLNGKTVSLGGSFTTSGAYATTFTMTGATNVTFPTSGTLLSTAAAVTVAQGGTGATTAAAAATALGVGTTNAPAFAATSLSSAYPYLRFQNTDGTAGEKWARMDWENARFAFQLLADDSTTWVRDLLLLDKNGNATFGGALTLGTALAANQGGTGQSSYAVGDILYASTTTALSKLAAGAAGTVLLGNGAGAAPSYGTLDLSFLPSAWTKKSARVATTANLTASYASNMLTNSGTLAALVIDGITLSVGNRVLVKNQTTALQNGLYYVSDAGSASVAWVLVRVPDCNFANEMANAVVSVEEGTQNGLWRTTFKGTDTVGTSAVNWYQVLDTSSAYTKAEVDALGGGGAMVLLSTATLGSDVAQVDYLTAFSSTYDTYIVHVQDAKGSASANWTVRLAVGGVVDSTSPNYSGMAGIDNTGGGSDRLEMTSTSHNTAYADVFALTFNNVNSSNLKHVGFKGMVGRYNIDKGGWYSPTGAVSGFRLYLSSGNVKAGTTVRIYGVKKS